MQRFLSIIILACLLVSCSGIGGDTALPTIGPGPDNGSGNGQGVISFAIYEYERQIYEPLVERFQSENPSFKVVLINAEDIFNYEDPNTTSQQLLRQLVSKADTFSTNTLYLSEDLYTSPLLLDLKVLMDADASFQANDFYPGVLERNTRENRIVVLPQYFYVQTLKYNKALFAQANLPEPQLGWTWNDLLGAAQAIGNRQSPNNSIFGYYDSDSGLSTLDALLQSRNYDILAQDPASIQLDSEVIAETIEQIRTLSDSGAIFNDSFMSDSNPISGYELISQGRIGIWNSQQFGMFGMDEDSPETIGIIPFPAGSNVNQNISYSDGFMISAGTQNPNASWKWIEFLSRNGTDNSGRIEPGFNTNRVPSRESLAQSINYWSSIDENTAAVYKWILENQKNNTKNPSQFNYSALYGLSTVLSSMFQNKNSNIAQLLREAQSTFQEEMANIQTTPTPTPDNNPVVVATPVIDQAPTGATVITFHSANNDATQIRRLARRFQQENPDVYVQLLSQNNLANVSGLSDLSKITDCFTWYEMPRSDADFNSLLNIQPLFDSDSSFPINDYPRAVFGSYTYNGGIYGLPYLINLQTFNYNRTAFEAAGIDTPNANWTTDDILAAAQTLTSGSGDTKQYGYISIQGPLYDLVFFANNHFNARLSTGTGEQLRANFGDPNVVKAIQWYIDLSKTHQVMPPLALSYSTETNSNTDPSWEYVMNGRGNMWFGYGRMFYDEQALFEEGLTALPVGASGLNSNLLSSSAFYISSQSQNPQACWKWLKFLSNETDPSFIGGSIPARISLATSPSYTGQAAADTVALYQMYSEVLQREPSQGDMINELYNIDLYWFFKAIDDANTRNANLEQALIEAQNTTNAYLDCLVQNGKPRKTATCANQVDPNYKGYSTEDETDNPIIGIPRG